MRYLLLFLLSTSFLVSKYITVSAIGIDVERENSYLKAMANARKIAQSTLNTKVENSFKKDIQCSGGECKKIISDSSLQTAEGVLEFVQEIDKRVSEDYAKGFGKSIILYRTSVKVKFRSVEKKERVFKKIQAQDRSFDECKNLIFREAEKVKSRTETIFRNRLFNRDFSVRYLVKKQLVENYFSEKATIVLNSDVTKYATRYVNVTSDTVDRAYIRKFSPKSFIVVTENGEKYILSVEYRGSNMVFENLTRPDRQNSCHIRNVKIHELEITGSNLIKDNL
jgi:hypothetical protein